MHRCSARFAFVSFAALIAGCAQSVASGAVKTEALPADGGDVGKSYAEFASAVAANDKARLAKFAAPDVADKGPSYFQMLGDMSARKPIGGRRQGDHATLFLQIAGSGNGNSFELWNAKLAQPNWQFENPFSSRIAISYPARPYHDCSKRAEFPCGVTTAPDSIVSGSVTLTKFDSDLYKTAPVFALFDGFAVRMFEGEGKEPKSTRIYLSSMGILPQTVTDTDLSPGTVRNALTAALLDVDVAANGKLAQAAFWQANQVKKSEIKEGIAIESNDGKRIRGRVKTSTDSMAIDVYFDIATASGCHSDDSDTCNW